MALVVTLLGGESTGKSTLSRWLHARLVMAGVNCVVVPEHLRTWCESHGRAPWQHEQAGLAQEQAIRIDAAAQTPTVEVVVADTAPLVVAAYSAQYFDDPSLMPSAIQWQRHAGLTFLMGLDLPWVADGLFRDGPAVRDATDVILREALELAGIPFLTVYGQGDQRGEQALRAIGRRLGRNFTREHPDWAAGRRPWQCEKCSDPDCEHRLFSNLIAGRAPYQ